MNLAYATAPDRRKNGKSRQRWTLKNTSDHSTKLQTVRRLDWNLNGVRAVGIAILVVWWLGYIGNASSRHPRGDALLVRGVFD
jgi:uncharacterized membrane-anchored protein